MKKSIITAVAAFAAMTAMASVQTDTIAFANTIKVWPTESKESVMAKAAHVVPNSRQLGALQNEFIAFIHFGPNTFSRREWGTGFENPKDFAPEGLDADQWVRSMKDAGMKMVVITVKHHDGFVTFQSRYTDHGIMSSDFMDGKGDVLRDLSEACARHGMKLGVYLSPADLYQIESPAGLYGNLSERTLRTIPREVEGRPFKNPTKFQFVTDDYNEYFMNQLFELLTEYGPIHEVWFDGAHPKTKGGQKYDYESWKKLIHTLAPEAVVFGREDVRWCGNEAGSTRETEWNVMPYYEDPDTMTQFHDIMGNDLGSLEKLMGAPFLHYQQAETDTSIREGWFYRDDDTQSVRSADDVFDIYERSVGGNSTLILNIPPNRAGRFSPRDSMVLADVGQRIRETYGHNLADGAKAPAELLDGDIRTWVDIDGDIVIELPEARTFNRVVLQEAVADRGERIARHAVDVMTPDGWSEVASATNVGYKRILRFPDVTSDKLRIRVVESRLKPTLATVSVHRYNARAPQLDIKRDINGDVDIDVRRHDFNWHNSPSDGARNLASGSEIHYTVDGTEPTVESALFTEPFKAENCKIRAKAWLNGEVGPEVTRSVGYIKQGVTAIAESVNAERFPASAAVDARTSTVWVAPADSAVITFDLGAARQLKGISYTPQNHWHGEGMIAVGDVEVSADGKKWTKAGRFEFGNLINDPTERYYEFAKPVKGRYVRLTPLEIAGESNKAAIAEIDFF